MNSDLRLIIFFFLSIIFFAYLVRARKIYDKYVSTWILLSGLIIYFSLFPSVFLRIGRLFGFNYPSNFVLLASVMLSLFLIFQLSTDLSKLRKQVEQLAIEHALVENKLREKNKSMDL